MVAEKKQQTIDSGTDKKLWNISWDLWDRHNEALHNSQNNCDAILDSQINNRVCALFASRLLAVPHDAFGLFHSLLDDILQCPTTYKEQWVASVEATIKQKNIMNMVPIFRATLHEMMAGYGGITSLRHLKLTQIATNYYMAQHTFIYTLQWQTGRQMV